MVTFVNANLKRAAWIGRHVCLVNASTSKDKFPYFPQTFSSKWKHLQAWPNKKVQGWDFGVQKLQSRAKIMRLFTFLAILKYVGLPLPPWSMLEKWVEFSLFSHSHVQHWIGGEGGIYAVVSIIFAPDCLYLYFWMKRIIRWFNLLLQGRRWLGFLA
jgi:hypothetical protein